MAIPNGTGTEVLKNLLTLATDATEHKVIDGTALHIYTLLSITFCETGNAAETFSLFIADDAGSNDCYLLKDQALAAKETFVWNDRIVLVGTDELTVVCSNPCAISIATSYIDQDWT